MLDHWCLLIGGALSLASLIAPFGQARGDDTPPPDPSIAVLPTVDQLPNPFTFQDGSIVTTPADWDRRRAELKRLFQEYEYGHLPPKPESLRIDRNTIQDGPALAHPPEAWTIRLGQETRSLIFHATLTMPRETSKPCPVVIRPNAYPGAPPTSEAVKGFPSHPSDAPIYLDAGIAVLEFNLAEVAIDDKEQFARSGIHTLFDSSLDAGALMAWAWGFHRMVDAIETDGRLDASKIIVTGHSRFGKAALVAGAFDERIALTVPNHSGCGGAAPYRFLYGKSEALPNIVGRFPHWFQRDLSRFVGQVNRLPVDQHELRALVAPRAILDTEGTADAWSNPEGSQLAHQASQPVYDFLDVPDRIAIRFRPVGHVITSSDVVEYAAHLFDGKPLPPEFNQLPYPEERHGFAWQAPATARTSARKPAP